MFERIVCDFHHVLREVASRRFASSRFVNVAFACALVAVACFASPTFAEPNLEGVNGLINTPTAETTADGAVFLGVASNLNFTDNPTFGGLNQISHYFNIGFLPDFEISGRITRYPDFEDPNVPRFGDYKERELSLKWRLLDESPSLPSFAIGALDIGGEVRHQKAYYAVAQKTFFENLKVSLGGGTEKLEGVFGGVEWSPFDKLSLIAEYDTEGINAGVRVNPWKWLTLSAVSLDGEEFGWNAAVRIDLSEKKTKPGIEPSQPLVRFSPDGGQADPRILAERLADQGFENVRAFVSGDTLVVTYENRMYLLEERALGIVLTLASMYAPGGVERVSAVSMIDGIPHLDTTVSPDEYLAFMRDEVTADELKERIEVDYHRGAASVADIETVNPIDFKTDLFFKYGFDFDAGRPYEPFKQRISLIFDPEVKLGSGFFYRGRASYTVNNNLNDIEDFNIERSYLGFGGRSGNLAWLAKGGLFAIGQYGGQLEAEYDIADLDATVGVNLGLVRDDDDKTEYLQALGKLEKRFPKYDLTARIHGGQFLYEDGGFHAELIRSFGDVEVSFFAYSTGEDTVNKGGFSFSVPLPFYDDSPPRNPRFGIAPEWGFTYRTDDLANGIILTAGQELRRYRRHLYPDYILAHVEDLRFSRWLIK